jgi:hypothetical protein
MSYNQFGARGGKFSTAKPKSDVEWAMCVSICAAAPCVDMTSPSGYAPRKCRDLEDTTRSPTARAAAASSGESNDSAALACEEYGP